MDNKYLFRLYHFNKNGNISSPFLASSSSQFGIPITATSTRDDTTNDFGALWHKGRLYPRNVRHFGFSTIGKVDPRYSIFSGDTDYDFDDGVFNSIHKELTASVPKEAHGQQTLKNLYTDGEKDDYEFLTNTKYSPRERSKFLHKFNTGKDIDGANAFTISPKWFNFDSDNVWDDLAYDIDMYRTFDRPDEGDKVVLVTTPEDKILSVDELTKKGYTQQRDFPSEIVTSEITPLRVFSEYPKALAKYDILRDKGASGPEAFSESFKIEPKQIASDAQLKNIYVDMCRNKDANLKQCSILKGIKELGQ